jgi:hypothetical protein
MNKWLQVINRASCGTECQVGSPIYYRKINNNKVYLSKLRGSTIKESTM